MGALGVALLVSLFLHWFGAGSQRQDAWQSFAVLDVVLAVVGLMAVAVPVLAATQRAQAVPLATGSLLVLIGVVASVWLLLNVASPPDVAIPHGSRATGYNPGTDRLAGLWIGLVACLGTTLAALWSIRDDHFPRAVVEAARVDAPVLPAPPREAGS